MKLNKKIAFLGFVLLLSLPLAGTVYAQQAEPSEDEVNAVAKKLYCPVCPNTPLDVCETQACQDWRAQIKDQLSGGWTEEQVISYFVTQYGERVLAEPQRSGFTSMVWMLPVMGVTLGVAVVGIVVYSWKKAHQDPTAFERKAIPVVSAEIQKQIEKELLEEA